MRAVLAFTRGSLIGFKARKLRVSLHLTQQKLAEMAGVSLGEVELFEHNLPLALDARRRILKGLWAIKANQH